MAIYHSWTSVSGNATNPGNAFDGSYGNVSTYANLTSYSSLFKTHTWQNSTSLTLTGITSLSLKIRRSYRFADTDTGGEGEVAYSWDGTNWYNLWTGLGGEVKSDTSEESFTLGNYNSGTNLNTLRIRATARAGRYYDELGKTVYSPSNQYIYDLAVDASSGPVLTVNAISGSTSLQAGHSAQYSTTVTNNSTNNCTWTIVSGGGSLSGAVNDATSTRVTWTAPNTSGGSAVLKCTSNIDSSKYAQITVSVPAITVNAISGTTTVYAGQTSTLSTTIANDDTNYATWSLVSGSGSVSGSWYNGTNTGTTYTAPTASGSGLSGVVRATARDTSKTAQVTITVPAVGVSMYNGYWGPTWPVAAGSTVTHSALISNHNNTTGSWSASGGSLSSQTNDSTKNYINWTYPTVPGKYTITFTHGIDTAKSVTVTTYVDYLLPSNTSESDPSGVASLSNPSYIWDEDAGTACDFYVGSGSGQGDWSASMEVFGFPSMGSCYTITLSFDGSVYGMGGGVHVQWSHDGGSTWGSVTNLDGAFNGNFTRDLTTPQGSFNASNLRFRFTGSSWAEYERDGSQVAGGDTAFTLIGLYVKVKTRGYGAVTDYVAPTTTNPRQVFPGNMWNLSTGTISQPTTTTPAIMSYDREAAPATSGPRILKYFVGAV
jgi:hypothetical protein